MVCENFPNLVKVTFICNRKKKIFGRVKKKKNVLQKFQGTKTKGRDSIPSSAVNFRAGNMSNSSQVQYEVPLLVRKKESSSSQLCVKFENGFFQSCSLCPLSFSWAASPFPSNCLGKLVGHIQTIAVPGTSKFGEDHTLCSLSEFLWYQWNTDHFQSGFWGGSYDVVRFSTLFFYSLGSDSTPLFSIFRVSGHETESCCIKKETAFSGD